MDFKLRLELKQTQKLLITPTLQQAIKLLQLTKMDLEQLVRQEMEENPVLEEEAIDNVQESEDESYSSTSSLTQEKPDIEPKQISESEKDFNWEDYFNDNPEVSTSYNNEPQEAIWENTFSRLPSLTEHLTWQLRLYSYSDVEFKIGEQIIGNIDENGYLRATAEEIADLVNEEVKLVNEVLVGIIQAFDPIGVGTRDLRECLLKQVIHKEEEGRILKEIISYYLMELETKKYNVIARKLGISINDVKNFADIISHYDPKPGLKYNAETAQYVIPDVYVYKLDDEFVVVINDDGIPRLRISNFYKQLLQEKKGSKEQTTKYIQEKMRSAVWLIKSIQQRQMTLYKVACSIVKFQLEFLDKGISYLRPLTLKDVAMDISMHESTVSRVTTNKYIHSPRGIHELKYFFHSGLDSGDGGSISSIRIRRMIKQLVSEEDEKNPYTDNQIVNIMSKRNIKIARRTVTKYREVEKILSSNKRRVIY